MAHSDSELVGMEDRPEASAEDRRDSLRIPIQVLVREAAIGSFDEREGNLGLGGIYFTSRHPPSGNHVDLRFLVPGTPEEVRAAGEVLRVEEQGGAFGVHVRFSDLTLEAELAIARYLQRQ